MLMQLNNPQKTGAWQIIKKDIDTLQYNFLSMQYRKIQSYEKPDKGSETCVKTDRHRQESIPINS